MLADWSVFLEVRDFLTVAHETRKRCSKRLLRSVAALPDATPLAAFASAIGYTADVVPDMRAALLQVADGATLWTALAGAVVTSARQEDLPAIGTTVKGQAGMTAMKRLDSLD